MKFVISILVLALGFTAAAAEKTSPKKSERKPDSAEFIGCWDSAKLGIVSGEGTFLISRGKDSLWLKPNSSKGVAAVLRYAALSPVKGWNICLSGMEASDGIIQVTEASICTHDETVGACDPGATIANSKLLK